MSLLYTNNKQERQDVILKQINIHTRVTFYEMSKMLDISEDTIRRDINELAQENKLIKIKGGAMAYAYSLKNNNEAYASQEKVRIAQKALRLLKPHSIILIGGGTTLWELIKILPDDFEATFLTVSVLTAAELLNKPNIKTIFIGGRISHYSQMAVSGEVFNHLQSVTPDYCILGTNAIDHQKGLTDTNWDTVQVKKEMIRCAKETIILCISEKLNSAMPIQIAPLSNIDYLVTELDPNDKLLLTYRQSNLTIL